MHPTQNWVYGADRGLSPSDFAKWDVSTCPSSSLGDSPYHGDFAISGNIWIAEAGDRLLVASGNSFQSISDVMTDMTYAGRLSDDTSIKWADSSLDVGEWVVLPSTPFFGSNPDFDNKLVFYITQFLQQTQVTDLTEIPASTGPVGTEGSHVFFSDDGASVIVLLEGNGLLNSRALQITTR